MRDVQIKIDDFHLIDLLKVKITKRPNEHSTALVAGHISDEDNAAVERGSAGQRLVITGRDESGTEKILFDGLAAQIEIEAQNVLRKTVLKKKAVQGRDLFRIGGIKATAVIVSLMVAESLLRRESRGIRLTHVEVE